MEGLWVVIIVFVVVIKVIDLIVMSIKETRKKRKIYKSYRQKTNFYESEILAHQAKNSGYVKGNHHKIYNYEDDKSRGEITRFKRPDSLKTSSVQEELKETVWDKDFLMSIEWKVFEDVCAEYLRLKNCNGNVTNTGKDGGIDLKVTDKAGIVIALGQCKAWSKPIGVSLVRELYGIMAAENVRHGVYITTSTFTNDALAFASNKRMVLINGDDFINNINALNEESKTRLTNVATVEGYTIPTCASCNVKMVKRTAKTGNYANKMFWGCCNFPRCRNKLQVRKEINAF